MIQASKIETPTVSKAGGEVREAGYCWPINEIVMESHVLGGESDAEIARTYRVMRQEVTALRQVYGL